VKLTKIVHGKEKGVDCISKEGEKEEYVSQFKI
jgi:hypothetical protein